MKHYWKIISVQIFQAIDLIFAIWFSVWACALIKKLRNLAIDQNFLIDWKIENTLNFSTDCQFFSQLNFSSYVIAIYIILSYNFDHKTVVNSKWTEIINHRKSITQNTWTKIKLRNKVSHGIICWMIKKHI